MAVTSDDEAGLAQTQSIIESHLVRFAFRENLEALDWQRRLKWKKAGVASPLAALKMLLPLPCSTTLW